MTEARLIRPISYHGMDHISAIWCFWRSRMSSMSWNQVPFIPSGIIFVSLFEWSSDILRKMDFSSVWQLYKAVLVLVLIDTSSAFKVKIENLSWNWDFWSFWSFLLENAAQNGWKECTSWTHFEAVGNISDRMELICALNYWLNHIFDLVPLDRTFQRAVYNATLEFFWILEI